MAQNSKRHGMPFGIGAGFQDLILAAAGKDLDPLTPFYELVTNAMEAEGACRIWQVRPGHWVVADNGCGMNSQALLERLTKWASSGKSIGADKNFGSGLKYCVALGLVTRVTVTSREKDSADFYEVEFGDYGTEGNRGPLSTVGKDDEFVRKVKTPFGGMYSTVIEFEIPDDTLTPEQLLKALNKRLLRIPTGVQVNLGKEGLRNPRWTALKGAIALHEESCKPEMFGEIDLPNCKAHYGVRRDGYKSTEWDPSNLLITHVRRTCVYEGVTISSHRAEKLSDWGIHSGLSQISMIVAAKGRKVAITLGRGDISGWDQSAAQKEFIAEMPPLLASFMEVFQAQNNEQADKDLNECVESLLGSLKLGNKPEKKPRPELDPNRVIKPRVVDPDKEQGTKKPRKGTKGTPRIVFASLADTCGQGIMYEPVQHVLKVCYETKEYMAGLAEAERARKVLDFRAQVAVGCVSGWCKIQQEFGHLGFPGAEVLSGIYGASIVGAMVSCLSGRGTILDRIKKFRPKE